MFILGFPLLLVPFAIYNIIAFLMPGVSWTGTITSVHMMSGGDWTMSAGDMLIVLAIILLFAEMMKSTRIGVRSVVDHGLSLLLFLATPMFWLVSGLALPDHLAGSSGNRAHVPVKGHDPAAALRHRLSSLRREGSSY